jgi:hypothetical protein
MSTFVAELGGVFLIYVFIPALQGKIKKYMHGKEPAYS